MVNVGNIRSFRARDMTLYAGAPPITVTWLTITDLGGRRSRARKPTSRGTELLTPAAGVDAGAVTVTALAFLFPGSRQRTS